MKHALISIYKKQILERPALTLLIALLAIASLSFYLDDFKLDASADSLVLEHDEDLDYYRAIRARYGSDDYLIITYAPKNDLFATETLADITRLKSELEKIERVESVVTILDVPLIDSPRVTVAQLREETPTLSTPGIDTELVRKEFQTSPLYRNLIVSEDGTTTALQVNFKRDETYLSLLEQRNTLREKRLHESLTATEKGELDRVSTEFKRYTSALLDQEQQDIAAVRAILDRFRDNAEIHLGGIPMIVSDMIDYIEHDIRVFGIGVLCFMILLLTISFRKPRWVILPMVVCFAAGLGMVGFLGMMDWRVTVVSSNFISLLLIITLSLMVHLVVRYRELHSLNPDASQRELVWETVRSKTQPAFFTAVTTMVAFGSLLVSGIRPVIDFGWMMVFGVALAFVLAFALFPTTLMFLAPGRATPQRDLTGRITGYFASMIEKRGKSVIAAYLLLMALSVIGITSLTVENRFIDYFKESTEIYQGMITIDQKLGGTTPLDVVLEPSQDHFEFMQELAEEGLIDEEAGISGTSYWFNIFELENVDAIHSYLEGLSETGKVLSMATTIKLLTMINNDQSLDNISLAVMHKRLPEEIKKTLFTPYMSEDGNQIRFAIRVYESDVALQRQVLLDRIRADLAEKFGLEAAQINLTGMVVLYNNMLQSLFKSQIMTIGVVFLAILVMFLLLFRSVKIALIAIVPNVVAAAFVLGLMGLLGIHLDIMTITIAAITIGIAVDDTIHYIHRYIEEYPKDRDAWAAVRRCHASIGRAMYYTTITITLGFSILALSSFIPTIYFGFLTGFAMMVALIADLTLLPLLLVIFKPLK